MDFLITICARGGSKGIPGKNIRPLNGKPLLAYSIQTAERLKTHFENVTVALSTDDEAIKKIAADYGLETAYTRPESLATDTAGKIGVITDLLRYKEHEDLKKFDVVIDLDVTSPLRTAADVIHAFELLQNNSDVVNLFSVNRAHRNPYFNMVEEAENGFYNLVKKPAAGVLSRQAAPQVYDLNASFYIYRKAFFEAGYSSAITDKSLVYVMPHICFDLDEPVDFDFLEYLITHNKLSFEL